MRVGILGGGRWGQALARLALAAGNEPLIAYRDKKDKPPHLLPSTQDAPSVSRSCDLLVVATSASELRQAIRLAEPGPGNRVVVAGRGLEPESGLWLTDVILQECDAVRVGALAGPAPIDEILNGGLCAGVVASPYDEVREMVVSGLHSKRFRVYESDDLVGVQLAGAAMPVLAAMVGLATNLGGAGVGLHAMVGLATNLGGAGVGLHAMVVAHGLEEMSRLARAIGGRGQTLAGLAGVGDLVAVQAKAGHPNYELGKAIAMGTRKKGPPERLVGVAKALLALAKRNRVDTPMTEALVATLEGANPLEAIQGLMGRAAQPETR